MPSSSTDFTPLFSSLLKKVEHGSTLVVIPWGNVGDDFLRHGMCHLFRSHGISYQSIHISHLDGVDFAQFTRVAWGGGGNVCGRYQTEAEILKISKRCKEASIPFICLPQSLEGIGSHLYEFDTIYVREFASMALAHSNGLNAILCPDLSLAYPYIHHPPSAQEHAHFFRGDAESTGQHQISDPRKDQMSVEEFMHIARSANVIHTDLMHLAIAALKQGRKVFLHPGDWHKIESMYLTWLHNLNCELMNSPLAIANKMQ